MHVRPSMRMCVMLRVCVKYVMRRWFTPPSVLTPRLPLSIAMVVTVPTPWGRPKQMMLCVLTSDGVTSSRPVVSGEPHYVPVDLSAFQPCLPLSPSPTLAACTMRISVNKGRCGLHVPRNLPRWRSPSFSGETHGRVCTLARMVWPACPWESYGVVCVSMS
jgi:hypothetical protein